MDNYIAQTATPFANKNCLIFEFIYMFTKKQVMVCMMDTTNEGKVIKGTDKEQHLKSLVEKTFPNAVAKSDKVQYERTLLKDGAITNVRIWNNSTKTVLHDGWVKLADTKVVKCQDQECKTTSDTLVDYSQIDDMCYMKYKDLSFPDILAFQDIP
jgi:hypothetical protein